MTTNTKATKAPKSLDDEIAAAEERLKRLKQQKAEREQRELAKNQKAIQVFLRTEKLDAVPVEVWSAVAPQLRKLLKVETAKADATAAAETTKARAGSAERPSVPDAAPAVETTDARQLEEAT
jgi:hypothetical protein